MVRAIVYVVQLQFNFVSPVRYKRVCFMASFLRRDETRANFQRPF